VIRDRSIIIRTPEGIEFSLLLAGPIRRFLALAIDLWLIGICCSIVMGIGMYVGALSSDLAYAIYFAGTFIVTLGYPMFFEWRRRGQTPGKKWLRLQVVDESGLRLQLNQVIVRNLLRAVDTLPLFYLLGGLSSVLTRRVQRLGDLAARTVVLVHPKVAEPDFDRILPDHFNSFRDHPHLIARLRQSITATEAGIALRAVLRRDEFENAARLTLFARLRARFEEAALFPPTVTDGISDEQYVRNAVDVLFR
jgi:uncharacterized RDD family membrane protein YckC